MKLFAAALFGALLLAPGNSSADALTELRFWNPRADVANPPLTERTVDPETGLYTPPLSPESGTPVFLPSPSASPTASIWSMPAAFPAW